MTGELIEGEDFYYEGPNMVFTEKFLRERGSCCQSGCRHCPWGYRKDGSSDAPADESDADLTWARNPRSTVRVRAPSPIPPDA